MQIPLRARPGQGARSGQRPRRRRPLYLSAQEARALAVLSGTSPFALGDARSAKTSDQEEQALFERLGRFLRAF